MGEATIIALTNIVSINVLSNYKDGALSKAGAITAISKASVPLKIMDLCTHRRRRRAAAVCLGCVKDTSGV